MEVHARPMTGATPGLDPPARVLVAIRDISDQRRAERMRADFVANVSHELRTPLAALSGFIETLQGAARDDAEARLRFLAIMRVQAGRMARLIDDLLSLSRIEQKQHVPPEGGVDLGGVVGGVLDALTPLAAESGVILVRDFPEARIEVRGERDELYRVFENLIGNAIKYGQAGGRVEVTAATGERGEVQVSVRDHGPGIAPEHLPRLTERFYRVDVAGSRARGGTGLGLAIVKHIVARHRGRLLIDSTAGEGATFTVVLERLEGSAPAARHRSVTDAS
jgi:two-component system phosphate regulon sensor histidine kinase PhoR